MPGYGASVLDKEGNLCGYLDNLLLNGPWIGTHVWKTARTWDPEGVLSTVPAIATCLFGILTGQLLRARLSPEAKAAWLFTAGNVLLFLGQVMNIWLPINKNLWSSSYTVFMAGMAAVCFAVCYWLIDVQHWRKGTQPLAIYGMNAITVFVLSGILGRLSLEIKVGNAPTQKALKTWLYDHTFAGVPDPKLASLLWAISYAVLLYLVAYAMYRRKWFIRF